MTKPTYTPGEIESALETNWPDGIPQLWPSPNLTYEVGTAPTFSDGGSEDTGYQPMTAKQAGFVRDAFAAWSQVANVTFTEITGDPTAADITVAYSSKTVGDNSYEEPTVDADNISRLDHAAVWLNTATSADLQDAKISFTDYGFIAMLHEIGHALGLSHPGPYNAGDRSSGDSISYDANAVFAQDTRQYTVMSYFGYEYEYTDSTGIHSGWNVGDTTLPSAYTVIYPSTPMVYDMLTIQSKYGANMSTRAGDTTYGFNSNAGEDYYDFSKTPQVVFTIWDGGGHDTLNADFQGQFAQSIDLHAGAYSSVGGLTDNIGIAFGVTIEDATGGNGNDNIIGNDADNHLVGNEGDDALFGGAGNDTLDGGAGDDLLDGGGGHDTLTGGEGTDTFIYDTGYGITEITDFTEDTDWLDLTKAGVHSFADLMADGDQVDNYTVFNFGGGDSLILDNVQLDTLTPDQIEFSEPTQGAPGEFLLAPNSSANTAYPYYTYTEALANGGFVGVVLDANTFFTGKIEAQVYDTRGVAIAGDTFQVNTTQLGTDFGDVIDPDLQVVKLANGEFVAVWQEAVGTQNSGTFGPLQDIRYRVFSADGTPLGPDQVANDTPAVVQQNTYGPTGTSLTGFNLLPGTPVTATSNGGFAIQWVSDVTPDDNPFDPHQNHYFTRTFDAQGVPTGADLDTGYISPPVTNSETPVDLVLSSGATLRYWQASDGTAEHAYAQILGQTGVVQLDQGTGYVPSSLSVSELSDGRILFTWGAGGLDVSQFFTTTIYNGTEAVIYDSKLEGFTKPGTSGHDVLIGGLYNDQLYGLGGDDTLQGGPGADLLDGGPGNDTVDYSDSLEVAVNNQLEGVDVDLTRTGPQHGGHAEGDILVSIENIIGSSYDDQLVGDAWVNVIKGGFGRDHIDGGGGADQLYGGGGDDVITLRGVGGMASGDAGDDFITVLGNNAFAYGGDGNDSIEITGNGNTAGGDAGDDTLSVVSGSGNLLLGGDGDDHLYSAGSGSGNILEGGAGSDHLLAGDNTGTGETLRGGDGNDLLFGGTGNDILEGDGGNDILVGGAGIDTAVFSGNVADYTIKYFPGPQGGLQVEDMRPGSPDGTDAVFVDIEKLQFADGTYGAGYFETTSKGGDGYITGATVFADANGNGVLDSGDVYTTTDAGGGFTMPDGASGPLVLSGGTDTGTGLAFRGEFLAPAGYNEINPLTTIVELLTKDGVSNPEQTALTNLGLDPSTNLATKDPIADIRSLVSFISIPEKVSVQIADTVDLIASAIEGAHPGQFSVAYADAFQALATAIGNGSFNFNDALSSPAMAVSEVVNVIDATLSAGSFTLDPTVVTGVARIITAFNGDGAINYYTGSYGLAGMETTAKLAQGAAADVVKGAGANPSTISGAVDEFTGSALDAAIAAKFGLSGDIDGPYLNNTPATNFDSYVGKSNTELTVDAAHGVLANDVDYDGDPITAAIFSQPSHGTLALNADGSFTYTPDTDFAGTDTFYYTAGDGSSQSYQQNVSIEIDGPHPVVTGITTSPSSGVLHPGDTLTVTVTMSSAVNVDQPYTPLELFTNDFPLVLESGTGTDTDTLVFTGTLGDYVNGTSLRITGDDNDDYDNVHVTDALTGALADLSGAQVTFSGISVACYCPGTLILTDRGERQVEDLAIGDRLMTPSGPRPIKWIGRRSYGGTFIIGRRDLLPICFKAGSLGEGLPRRDLWISPHHAMYIDRVLIEARDLVNGVSVVQAEEVDRVDYFHIELDSHDVILAEGAWSETFVDDDSRGMFHNAHEFAALYPDDASRPARYCAPRLDEGFEFEAIRQRLARLAGAQGGAPRVGALRGFVDQASAGCIAGWAQHEEHPEAPVCLDIYIRGRLIGQALANCDREDLGEAGLGSGRHGFSFAPRPGCRFTPQDVCVRRALDGAALPMTALSSSASMSAAA